MLKFTKRHIKHVAILLNLIAITSLSISAQDGTVAYNFLNLTSSSHIYGLGGVNISTVEDNVNLIEQNPALLGSEMDMQLSFNYMKYVGETNFGGLKFAKELTDRSAIAAGVQYFGYGKMKYADEFGNVSGTFEPKDIAFNIAYSHDIFDNWRGGINLKYVNSIYDEYSATALAVDLGVNYYDPDKDLSVSLVAANLGGQIKRFNETHDRLPTDIRIGFTKGLENLPFRLSVTAWNLTKWKSPYYDPGDGTTSEELEIKESFSSNLMRHLVFAADYIPSERFHVGVGYNHKTRTDMTTYSRSLLSGFSACAGVNVKSFGIDVALSQPHTGATTFMINITTLLNDFIKY